MPENTDINLGESWKTAVLAETTPVLVQADSTAKISFEELLEKSLSSDGPILVYMHDPQHPISDDFKSYVEWKAAKEGVELYTFDINDVPPVHRQSNYLTGIDCGKVMAGMYPTAAPNLPENATDNERHRQYEQHEDFMQRDTSNFINRVIKKAGCEPGLISSLPSAGNSA